MSDSNSKLIKTTNRIWKKHRKGNYRVKSSYDGQQVNLWPWKHIWKVKFLTRWLIAKEAD